jgi:hypothetical protein
MKKLIACRDFIFLLIEQIEENQLDIDPIQSLDFSYYSIYKPKKSERRNTQLEMMNELIVTVGCSRRSFIIILSTFFKSRTRNKKTD